MPIVIDASGLAEVVARTERAPDVEAAFAGEELIAPDLVNIEVLAVLRKWVSRSWIAPDAANRAVRNLAEAPIRRYPMDALVEPIWELRHNLTPYDAAYVTLARWAGCPLLTLDERLTRAPDLGVALVRVRDGGAGRPRRP